MLDVVKPSVVINAEERKTIDLLRGMVQRKETLSSAHKEFLTDLTYCRFLRARGQNVDKAYKMLSNTLKWRSQRRPEQVYCKACDRNPRSHSLRPMGIDMFGRPVLYSNFDMDDRVAESNIQHLIHLLENLFELDGVTELNYVWVMDFQGYTVADLNPSFAVQSMRMFQSHYPERMGCVIVYDAPKSFYSLYKFVRKFIDESTKKKVIFTSHAERAKIFNDLFNGDLRASLEKEVSASREQTGREFGRDPEPLELQLMERSQRLIQR